MAKDQGNKTARTGQDKRNKEGRARQSKGSNTSKKGNTAPRCRGAIQMGHVSVHQNGIEAPADCGRCHLAIALTLVTATARTDGTTRTSNRTNSTKNSDSISHRSNRGGAMHDCQEIISIIGERNGVALLGEKSAHHLSTESNTDNRRARHTIVRRRLMTLLIALKGRAEPQRSGDDAAHSLLCVGRSK